MSLLLSECRSLLSRYAGSGNNFTDRVNLVRERLIKAGNFRGTKVRTTFNVYSDVNGEAIITLPRSLNTVLAGAYKETCRGVNLPIRNGWYEFTPGGADLFVGSNQRRGVIPMEGRFTTFADWKDPMRLRVKILDIAENAGNIVFKGRLAGEKVYSLNVDTNTWIEGESVDYTGTGVFTSTKYFDEPPYAVVKLPTIGRLWLYVVDDNNIETLVAVYEPSETSPAWRRYKVPQCTAVAPITSTVTVTPSQYYTKTELDAMFTDAGTITVDAAGSDIDLIPSAFFMRTVKIIAQAGAGSYVRNFTLNDTGAKIGGILRVRVEMAQSGNPTINFYDQDTSGALLQTIAGDSSNAIYETLVFGFDGTSWNFEGREL